MVNPENFFIENFDLFYVFKVFYLVVRNMQDMNAGDENDEPNRRA